MGTAKIDMLKIPGRLVASELLSSFFVFPLSI
jgi:hypothetical protein